MSRVRKATSKGRGAGAPGDGSRPSAGSGEQSSGGETRTISAAEFAASVTTSAAASGQAFEPLGRTPVDDAPPADLGGQAAESAAGGFDQAPAPPATMDPAELVGLVELAKGLLVRAVGASVKAPTELIEQLAPIPPMTRQLLDRFAVDAVKYLPALNANAPLVGALAFAGLVALDLYGATKRLKAAGAAANRPTTRGPSPDNFNAARPEAPPTFEAGPSAPFER